MDGNEKLHRLVCAAQKSRIMGNIGEVKKSDMRKSTPCKLQVMQCP